MVPAFNEALVIHQTIKPIITAGYKVVCVDDASNDKTGSKAREAGAYVIRHMINSGQGASLQTGFDYILQTPENFEEVNYVVTFDADGQHSLDDFNVFLEAFSKSPALDIALGSRFLSAKFRGTRLKSVVLRTMAFISKYSLGLKLTDRHNGYRVIKKDVLHNFQILSPGYEHADEFLHIIAKNQL